MRRVKNNIEITFGLEAVATLATARTPQKMAPRPRLEPGTYGLTERVTPVLIARKLKTCNEFLPADFLSF